MGGMRALFLFSFIFLSSCFEGGIDATASYISLPTVYFQCYSDSQNPDCQPQPGSNLIARIGWYQSASVNCEWEFKSRIGNGDSFDDIFVAWGAATTTYSGTELYGEVGPTDWVRDNAPIGQIMDTTYTLCAYLDVDEDGQYDFGEPVGEKTSVMPSDTNLEIINWTN